MSICQSPMSYSIVETSFSFYNEIKVEVIDQNSLNACLTYQYKKSWVCQSKRSNKSSYIYKNYPPSLDHTFHL